VRRQERLDNLISALRFKRALDVLPYPTGKNKQRIMFNYGVVNAVACKTF